MRYEFSSVFTFFFSLKKDCDWNHGMVPTKWYHSGA